MLKFLESLNVQGMMKALNAVDWLASRMNEVERAGDAEQDECGECRRTFLSALLITSGAICCE